MDIKIDKLTELYKKNNFLIDGKEVLLHNHCIYCDKCWSGKSKLLRGKQWNRISYPYIGNDYNGDLMCIGLNFNEFGGKNAQYDLINGNNDHIGVKRYLEKGKIIINFENSNYKGTYFWHRLAVYSNIILNGNISLNGSKLSEIYNRLVFLEAIKCSPEGNKSRPEPEMFNLCPKNILFKEIDILNPKVILFLGKAVSEIFKTKFKCINNETTKYIDYYEIIHENNHIKVFKIIHPSATGGNSKKIFNMLLELRNGKIL